jgi:hypothetical protein
LCRRSPQGLLYFFLYHIFSFFQNQKHPQSINPSSFPHCHNDSLILIWDDVFYHPRPRPCLSWLRILDLAWRV